MLVQLHNTIHGGIDGLKIQVAACVERPGVLNEDNSVLRGLSMVINTYTVREFNKRVNQLKAYHCISGLVIYSEGSAAIFLAYDDVLPSI